MVPGVFLLLDRRHEQRGGGLKALGRCRSLQHLHSGEEEGAPVQESARNGKQD